MRLTETAVAGRLPGCTESLLGGRLKASAGGIAGRIRGFDIPVAGRCAGEFGACIVPKKFSFRVLGFRVYFRV